MKDNTTFSPRLVPALKQIILRYLNGVNFKSHKIIFKGLIYGFYFGVVSMPLKNNFPVDVNV